MYFPDLDGRNRETLMAHGAHPPPSISVFGVAAECPGLPMAGCSQLQAFSLALFSIFSKMGISVEEKILMRMPLLCSL